MSRGSDSCMSHVASLVTVCLHTCVYKNRLMHASCHVVCNSMSEFICQEDLIDTWGISNSSWQYVCMQMSGSPDRFMSHVHSQWQICLYTYVKRLLHIHESCNIVCDSMFISTWHEDPIDTWDRSHSSWQYVLSIFRKPRQIHESCHIVSDRYVYIHVDRLRHIHESCHIVCDSMFIYNCQQTLIDSGVMSCCSWHYFIPIYRETQTDT